MHAQSTRLASSTSTDERVASFVIVFEQSVVLSSDRNNRDHVRRIATIVAMYDGVQCRPPRSPARN